MFDLTSGTSGIGTESCKLWGWADSICCFKPVIVRNLFSHETQGCLNSGFFFDRGPGFWRTEKQQTRVWKSLFYK